MGRYVRSRFCSPPVPTLGVRKSESFRSMQVCPVPHHGAAGKQGSADAKFTEPPDTADHPVPTAKSVLRGAHSSDSYSFAKAAARFELTEPDAEKLPEDGERARVGEIPAAGRGNSEDGKAWVNPS